MILKSSGRHRAIPREFGASRFIDPWRALGVEVCDPTRALGLIAGIFWLRSLKNSGRHGLTLQEFWASFCYPSRVSGVTV